MIVQDTCHAIVTVLMGTYIKFPTGDALRALVNGFENKWGFPQCVGSIDGSHIPISAPELSHTDYYNRKGWYSMIVQAVVDHEYIFRDICVGRPGSVHDARVFVNSSIYKKITEGVLDGEGCRIILGKQIPLCLVGDSAYPIQTWLMKPFTDNPNLTPQQKWFNYRISRARIVVENAFGQLKARWRRLLKRNDMAIEHIPTVISACCILHNICEIHGKSFNDTWLENDCTETEYQQPSSSSPPANVHMAGSNAPHDIRNTLMQYLYTQ